MLTLLSGCSLVGLFVVSYLPPPSTVLLWFLFLASLCTSGWEQVSLESFFEFGALKTAAAGALMMQLRFLMKQVHQLDLSSYYGISDWADLVRAVFHYQIASGALPHLVIQVCLERVIYIVVHSNSFILCYANTCTKYCFLLSRRPPSKRGGEPSLSAFKVTFWFKSVPLHWLVQHDAGQNYKLIPNAAWCCEALCRHVLHSLDAAYYSIIQCSYSSNTKLSRT